MITALVLVFFDISATSSSVFIPKPTPILISEFFFISFIELLIKSKLYFLVPVVPLYETTYIQLPDLERASNTYTSSLVGATSYT